MVNTSESSDATNLPWQSGNYHTFSKGEISNGNLKTYSLHDSPNVELQLFLKLIWIE